MSDSIGTEPDFVTATVAHHPRRTDVDPRAAKRAERQVATLFVLAAVLILASVVAYVVIPVDAGVKVPFLGPVGALNLALGLSLGLGILLIGLGSHPLGAQAHAGQRDRGHAPRDALGRPMSARRPSRRSTAALLTPASPSARSSGAR